MTSKVKTMLLASLLAASGPAFAEGFIVQFSGPAVPEKIVSYVNIEKVDGGECARSCVLTSKEFSFPKGTSGSAARSFDLPDNATRVCAHISSDVVIRSARFFSAAQKSVPIGAGESFGHYNGESYNAFGGDKWVYFACTPIGADAGAGLGLVITLK